MNLIMLMFLPDIRFLFLFYFLIDEQEDNNDEEDVAGGK